MDNTEYDEIYLRFMLGTYNPSAEVVGWLLENFEARDLFERCQRLVKYSDSLSAGGEWEFEMVYD